MFEDAACVLGNETNENYQMVIKAVTVHVMLKKTLQKKRYMRRFLRKPIDMKVKDFVERIFDINELLTFFPDLSSTVVASKIPDDKLLDLLESVMLYSWQRHMILQGFDPMEGTVPDLVDFCKRLEATEETPKTKIVKPEAIKYSKKMGQVVNFKKGKGSKKTKKRQNTIA